MLNDFKQCYLWGTAMAGVTLGTKETWYMFWIPTRKEGMGCNLR